jgi:ElaB/YqjD/DUF883 family membrane-anchored ribosome-binding protein
MLNNEELFYMEKQESPPLAAATAEDVQRHLEALRNDVSRLSQQLTDYVGTTGRKIARDTSQELEHAVREHPLTAVAVAMALGLVCGALWRR